MDSAAPRADRKRLTAHVEELAQGPRHSLYSPEGHRRAVEYISEAFCQGGLEVREHAFAGAGRTGVNLVGCKIGADPSLPPLLVTAHYDTVADSPGADDNASGVAVLLETARVLGKATVRRTIELVAFDMEELQPDGSSLVGSTAFVASLTKAKGCAGAYNLEMVGYTSGPNTQNYPAGFGVIFPKVFGQVQAWDFRGDFIAVLSRGKGIALGRTLKQAAHQWVPDLRVVLIEAPALLPLLPDFLRSDHASFWAAGLPAAMVTDTANFRNLNYHGPGDTPATLDLDFLTGAAQAVAIAVAHDAEATFGS